jgi:serine/threonine-protein kinase
MKCLKCQTVNPENSRFCNHCATPLPPSGDISAVHTKTLQVPVFEVSRGTIFAKRYEFIEELGKGGMGSVHKVFDKKIKEEVALKLLNPDIASDKRTIARFSNELKFARKIIHKNVCRMFDLNEEKGMHYITMEYVPGEDLKSMLRMTKQLSVGTAISIAKQVCEGLVEAHRHGVVHRDMKPSNIMIDKEGKVRIMDFGIARQAESEGITREGRMVGTPEYMSPEQVDGFEADHRSDIYSLGAILYEMLTGKQPYEGESSLSIALKHKTDPIPDPKELNDQIPEELARVIMKCM